MSRYTVSWTEDAEDELADIWNRATDKAAVTAADATIARLLASDPINNGTDLAEGLRKLVVEPLVVYYSVDLGKRFVEVSRVARCPP
jgi:plasmid stabilization system protein ParE